jgi:MoxR-like ATPase
MPETAIVYTRWFDPQNVSQTAGPASTRVAAGDRVDVPVYIYDEQIIRAVNVAGVTGRPLLVEGPSGCGKSSLAEHVAHTMDWDYYRYTVTSRTQAGDLLYRIDQLKRLGDAEAGQPVADMSKYVEPGVLWKAFDKDGAASVRPSKKPAEADPFGLPGKGRGNGTVVLLDEIDKADPDVPNNLLLPLGSYEFYVDELDFPVYAQRVPLVVLTTNNERRLPDAFLRRCVNMKLSSPDESHLITVGRAHYPTANSQDVETIAKLLLKISSEKSRPSTAEYLDTVRACIALKINPNSSDWEWLKQITAWKQARALEA